MRRFLKGALWVLCFAALLAGGFFVYTKWWDTGLLPRLMGEVKGTAVEAVRQTTSDVVGEAEQGVAGYVKQTGADIISSAGKSLLRFAASIVGESTSTPPADYSATRSTNPLHGPLSTGTLPAAEASGFVFPPPATAVVTKVGVPLTFSVNGGASYEVDWGDGVTDRGLASADRSQILVHSWAKQGDYTAVFRVGGEPASFSYSFPVRVYAQPEK